MVGSGPFGERSGSPMPVSVETFHALRDRQTSDHVADPGERGARINLLNWDGKGRPPGLIPPPHAATADPGDITGRSAATPSLGRPEPAGRAAMTSTHDHAVVLQAASVCLQYPDDTVLPMLPLVRRAVDQLPGGARTSG